jgi:phosphatidylinositol kinase/protein kinase (PI-3  family)
MPDIFQEAGVPLWLRPYEVLCTSSYTALIETIPDTVIKYLFLFELVDKDRSLVSQ